MTIPVQVPAHPWAGPSGCSYGSGLLRTAGLPASLLLSAASADFFGRIKRLEEAEESYQVIAARAADTIGGWLVPHPALPASDRGTALALRRRLHRGERVPGGDVSALMAVAGQLGGVDVRGVDVGDLTGALKAVMRAAEALAGAEADAARAAAAEEERLLGLPLELSRQMPFLGHLFREADGGTFADLHRRLARGEPWSSKRVRQRSEHLWRLIDRATAKTTPRGWFSQVSLLAPAADGEGSFPPQLTDRYATDWSDNVFDRRRTRARAALELGDLTSRLTLAPLHTSDGEHVTFWVADPDPRGPGAINRVQVRRTPVLAAVMTVLLPGAATLGEVTSAVAPGATDGEAAILRRVLCRLAALGIVEASVLPQRQFTTWSTRQVPAPAVRRDTGFLDVYREVAAPLPPSQHRRLEELVRHALRVAALAGAERAGGQPGVPRQLGERPRPLLQVLAEHIHAGSIQTAPQHLRPHWPEPADSHSPWARLLSWLGARADDIEHPGDGAIDVAPGVLDQLGVPDVTLDWPHDALLRPLAADAGAEAVLQTVALTGILDARFASALQTLHGSIPHMVAYREFLAARERATGATFVEVLAPPLTGRAANAVRRPLLTGAWTGDADIGSYCEDWAGARYIPLDAITLRQAGDRVVAETGGQALWPVHHTTREMRSPWRDLAELLVRANPCAARSRFHPLGYPLAAFPGRRAMPRITVAGALVLSCAQWRAPADLWDPGAPTVAKARALERLRGRLGLPRFLYVTSTNGQPRPIDLESLRAIRTLERVTRAGDPSVLLVEALPAPDQLPVVSRADPTQRHAAELLLGLGAAHTSCHAAASRARAVIARNHQKGGEHHDPADSGTD